MSSKQDIDTESSRQEQFDILLKLVVTLTQNRQPTAPAIVANGLYTSEQVQENLGVSHVTVATWIEFNGLSASKPGTSKYLFHGQDIIDFVKANKAGVTKPKNGRERNALRKAKAK